MVTIRDYLIPQPIWWQSCDNLRIWWQSCDYLITCYHLLSIIGLCFFVGKNTFAVAAPKLWPRVLHVGFPPCYGSDLLAIHLTRSTAWNGKKMQIIYSQLKIGNLVVFVIDFLFTSLRAPLWTILIIQIYRYWDLLSSIAVTYWTWPNFAQQIIRVTPDSLLPIIGSVLSRPARLEGAQVHFGAD